MQNKVIVSVISDLVTDQRVHRAALTLHGSGFEVLVIGRVLKNSLPLPTLPYKIIRFKLWREKGALFYAHYNLKLFFFLLNNPADILLSNDLDTLLPNFLISRFRKIKLVYDSHEYFTEVPELTARPFIQKIWKTLEGFMLPRLKNIYTVNNSIALIYKDLYKINVKVVRNVPVLQKPLSQSKTELRKELELPLDKKIFVLQGSGINIQRGAEEAVQAITTVGNGILLIIGGGDVIPRLISMVQQLNLEHKVIFKNKMPSSELRKYTSASDAGLSLDKDTNLNYRYSLPNKLFDYFHAGIPVIASNLPEVASVINQYNAGIIIQSHQPEEIARCMNEMINDEQQYERLKKNSFTASRVLNWQKEEQTLLSIFSSLE